ncbi:hypothetical protein MHO82_22145 [Vibrio sp. Of7-15]|uniref:hypothetical protein n=1 Tax=Vibrio sp. Of7-15 TaxID=2724879 RepID=UPI001EF36E71|nr:hypothetical protein [Vibrio sp. Of7-15]MCG7499570.1 hypothetical protein [Vibrio sp. Of7-15]
MSNLNLEKIKTFAKDSKHVPTVNSAMRAGVSAIPMVGGALDHLLFDKADDIRIKNIESSISEMGEAIKSFESKSIEVEWFSSPAALNIFKVLIDKVQFEPDAEKVSYLSKVYALSGNIDNYQEPNKYIIFDKLASLTTVQRKLFEIVAKTTKENRSMNQGALQQNVMAIWFDSIKENVLAVERFWQGMMNLDVELEILVSLNLLKLHPSPITNMTCFELTGIGKLLFNYTHKG